MDGEGKHQDYKIDFDPDDEKAKVDLIKNLVAMANASGGQIVFGRDETHQPGIDEKACQALDSARVADLVNRYIAPATIELSHDIERLENGRFILALTIGAVQYPIVMARKGDWKGMDSHRGRPLFLQGDIWVRHSSKTERIAFGDMRAWIERAQQEERERILSRITQLVNLPEGTEIQVVSSKQQPIDSPQRLLEYATMRHEYDPSHLLSSSDLAYLFVNRHALEDISQIQLRLLISSALRRPPTLYWWLLGIDDDPHSIIEELEKCFDAADRDKSDAARSIIELAAIFAGDNQLDSILEALRASRYQHFREAAVNWQGRDASLRQLRDRVFGAKYERQPLLKFSVDDLDQLATEVAIKLFGKANSADSRKLADITRVIWTQKSQFAYKVRGHYGNQYNS